MMKTKSFEVRKGGNVRVKVYATASKKNGQTYTQYKVCDYFTIPGKRKLFTFADEADAMKKSGEIAEAITNGQEENSAADGAVKARILRSDGHVEAVRDRHQEGGWLVLSGNANYRRSTGVSAGRRPILQAKPA